MTEQKTFYFMVLVIIAVILTTFVMLRGHAESKGFSNNPTDWIDNSPAGSQINLKKATQFSYSNVVGQQFGNGLIETVFINNGAYLGNAFGNEYKDNEGNVLIRFTSNLDPSNGIPEGYIFEIIEDEPVAHIFLDEDWKNTLDFTNIVWGRNFENIDEFFFNEIQNGIYYQKINDDKNRFSEDYKIHYAGIIVGQVTLNNIRNQNANNAIFIKLK